jgi:hypothetical protein
MTKIENLVFHDCTSLTHLFVRGCKIHGNFEEVKDFEEKLEIALSMLDNKDFSVKLESAVKYPFILAYYRKTEDQTAFTYIKKQFSRIVTYAIEQNDIAVIESLIAVDKLFTKKNIDKFITKAIDSGKHEIQLLLMDYKNQIGGYTNIETDIEKRFKL